MQHKKIKKRLAGLLSAVFAMTAVISLLQMTAAARESGNVVLLEDYYGLTDGNAAQVPGLRYICSGHNDRMIEYYVEVEDDGRYTVPGIIEKIGNKLRYVAAYYCPTCYATWKDGPRWTGEGEVYDDGSSPGRTLDDYMEFVANNTVAGMASYGYYYPPKDDSDHAPQGGNSTTATITEQPNLMIITDEEVVANAGKALTTVAGKMPDERDPLAHWDMPGAYAFYNFFYTGMRTIVNKPSDANDPAWDTVRDATRIYFMNRQQEKQLEGPRINYSSHWYSYDYSMLGEWVVTDLMAEYATGEICGYVTYVGQKTEIAIPENVTVPLYGNVKIIGVDIEDHNLKKVYINDNVTCIRRLSSVNLEEISGCKNLEYIEKYAFQNDVSLKTIPEMPKLDWIAMGAFEGCISLRDIKLPDNMTFIDFTAFGWYDTILGNYDIGISDQSWEDFQYLSDLSDNDKILGLTLYAREGSTTWQLLDALINKNDALTPALDDDGRPYFRSYGDAVAMMSGEVKNYTSHWSLKSSGDYKGDVASTDKDVDDSTGGRLGEYDGTVPDEPAENPLSWLKQFIGWGGTTFLLLWFLLTAVDFAGNKPEPRTFKTLWGLVTVDYDKMLNRVDRNRGILESLDKLSSIEFFDKFGKYGKLFDAGVGVSKALQKAADEYGKTGNWRESLVRGLGSYGAGQLVGAAAKADPNLAIWDIATAEIFKGSAAADAVNAGSNAENLFDYFLDLAHTASSGTRAGDFMDAVYGGKSMSYGELADKMMNGDYGANIKNLVDAEDILLAEDNGDLYNAVFGEEGMGAGEFFMGFGDTAEKLLIKGNIKEEKKLERFKSVIKWFYTKGGAK